MSSIPIRYRWDGEAMVPLQRFTGRANRDFVVGETYDLVEHLERSTESHRHYFAVVREAWMNLPEVYAGRFPSPDALRKFALVKAGYADVRTQVCGSEAEAQRMAAFITPIDDFALVEVKGRVVTAYSAKSQAIGAMARQEFQASKDAVFGVLADMLGVDADALGRAA